MFASPRNYAKSYADIGVETGVSSADPHRLVLMLFDGALQAIATASRHMREKDVAGKVKAVSRAIDIINDGLKACLDVQAGGELAERLDALYDYMSTRLIYANLRNDQPTLDEVSRLLKELKGAWEEIGKKPAVHSENRVAA